MLRIASALAAGLLFGLGLVVSGMINPAKVLGFLDIAGPWDPSLAFVMAGAIPVAAAGFWLARRRVAPILEPSYEARPSTRLDARLVIGAVVFGLGWGLVGFCPGPAVAALGIASWKAWLFVASMGVGMAGFRLWDRAARSDGLESTGGATRSRA